MHLRKQDHILRMMLNRCEDCCGQLLFNKHGMGILKIEKISPLKLNARNAPGAHPYCNCQLLKISQINTVNKFTMGIILNIKISRSTVYEA